MTTPYTLKLKSLDMTQNPDTEFWTKHVQRDGFDLRLSVFEWTAAGRLVLRVHAQGRREELCRWTIGALEPEGSVMWLARYDMGDLRALHVALGLLLETVAQLEPKP